MSQFGVETQKISARSARSIVLYPILKIVALPIYKLCHRPPTRTRPDHSSSPPPFSNQIYATAEVGNQSLVKRAQR